MRDNRIAEEPSQRIAEEPSQEDSKCLWEFGDFSFRTRPFRLTKAGGLIALRPQTAELLELLVRNEGRCIDRDIIRENLWDAETFVDFEHSINFAVRDLRKVLGDSAKAPRFIETVPRRGYRFVSNTTQESAGWSLNRIWAPARRPLAAVALVMSTLFTAGLLFGENLSGPRSPLTESPADLTGAWVGTADLGGGKTLVQLDVEAGVGSIEAFGGAPLKFDGRFLKTPVHTSLTEGSGFRMEFVVREERLAFEGSIVGDILSGSGEQDGGEIRALRMADPETLDLSDLVGVYQSESRRLAVTWREYGGLRAIDLDTGEAESLFPVSPRAFLSEEQVTKQDASEPWFRFPVDRAGQVVALERGDWRSPETLYREDAVVQEQLDFRSDGVKLSGTLLTPMTGVDLPAVVLVHGSGPIYRTALLQRALWFVESGFAAFIYDKRGTGTSDGDRRDDHFPTLVGDIRAAVEATRSHPSVDASRVGLQGHSQAGYLIPIVAADDPAIAFAIVVNGGGIGPAEQSMFDKANDLERAGFNGAEKGRALQFMAKFFAYFRDREGERASLERDYLAAKQEAWFGETDLPDLPGIPSWDNPPAEMIAFAEELRFGPVGFQEKMKQPVLVLLGAQDETVPAKVIAESWTTSLIAADNSDFKIVTIPDANHGMRLVRGANEGLLSPNYKQTQASWLEQLFQ